MTQPDAVLFIGYGGPEKREDVAPFLERIAQGRKIPRERLKEVAHHYEAIGGTSPINEITRRQAACLEMELARAGVRPSPNRGSDPCKVYVGQRNWHPFLEDTLRQMAADGVRRAVGFIAAPHRCAASYERYTVAVEAARERIGSSAPAIEYTGAWFDHPFFIEAIAQRVLDVIPASRKPGSSGVHVKDAGPPLTIRGGDVSGILWIFTAHSIPTAMAKTSPYVQELTRTAELVAERYGQEDWQLAYCSRSGNPREPWLEPEVCEAVRGAAVAGRRGVLLIPIGFIAENVEVLFDLDVEARAASEAAGIRYERAMTVGDHPAFVRMMAEVVRQ